jgi:hypothetical protein
MKVHSLDPEPVLSLPGKRAPLPKAYSFGGYTGHGRGIFSRGDSLSSTSGRFSKQGNKLLQWDILKTIIAGEIHKESWSDDDILSDVNTLKFLMNSQFSTGIAFSIIIIKRDIS